MSSHLDLDSSLLTYNRFLQKRHYGRRQTRSLKGNQQKLWQDKLPNILLDLELCRNKEFWNHHTVCLEIGFGGGEHLIHQAINHPSDYYIGCEPFVNGVASLLQGIDQYHLNNILVYPFPVNGLLENLPDQSIDIIFLLFADPWPKTRHHKRRFIQESILEVVHGILKPNGIWHIATDHGEYQKWILDHFSTPKGKTFFKQLRDDIYKRPNEQDWPKTRYEQKALNLGRQPIYLTYKKIS